MGEDRAKVIWVNGDISSTLVLFMSGDIGFRFQVFWVKMILYWKTLFHKNK